MRRIVWFLCAMAMLATSSCKQSDTIPLTTDSAEAKQHFLRGMELAESARRDEARNEFAAAAMIDSGFAMAYFGLAIVQPKTAETYQKLSLAEELSRPHERRNVHRTQIGINLAGSGSESSSTLFSEATKRINKVSEGERLWILGQKAQFDGNAQAQFDAYSQLAKLYPRDERVHRYLGDYWAGKQQFDSAITEYQRAISLKPDNVPAYNMLGYYCVRKEDIAGAEAAFRKQTEIAPNEPNPFDSFAEFLLTQGRYEESLENYRRAIALDSGFVNARVGAATNLIELGRHEDARKYLKWPNDSALDASSRGSLGIAEVLSYYDEGNIERSLEVMRAGVEFIRASDSPYEVVFALNLLGRMYLDQNRLEEAKAVFEEAHKIVETGSFPEVIRRQQEAAYYAQGVHLALRKGDVEAAARNLSEIEKRIKEDDYPYVRALASECRGCMALYAKDYDKAVSELAVSNLTDPYDIYRLGLAYQGKGELQKARAQFEKVSKPRMLNNVNYIMIKPRVRETLKVTAAVS